ncbi:MAG: hypothetical protein VX265_16635 [Myxococcota bacterium]|nr:hypothetical protein [Myxococcota bacterium]
MLLLVLLPLVHAGDCVVDRLASTVIVERGEMTRRDRWTLGAEPGATGCRLLDVPPGAGLDLVAVSGLVMRPDRQRVRFAEDRLQMATGPAWSEPAARIHIPDADIGSTVELELQWRGLAGSITWSPAALGPVGVAVLDVQGATVHAEDGPLDSLGPWQWADVPASQPALRVVSAGRRVPTGETPQPMTWRIGGTHADVAIAAPAEGRPLRFAAPGGWITAARLRAAGVQRFVMAIPSAPADAVREAGGMPVASSRAARDLASLATPSRDPEPPGPGCVMDRLQWACVVSSTDAAWRVPVGEPAPGSIPVSRVDVALTLAPDDSQTGGADEPPTGRASWSGAWRGQGGDPPILVVAPPDAEAVSCATGMARGRANGRVCRFPPGAGPRSWSWTSSDLPVVGTQILAPPGASVGRLVASAPGAQVEWRVDGAVVALEAERPPAVPDGPGVHPVVAGTASWRIARVGPVPVLPDRHTTIQRVALLGIRASMPEPGLPLRFKNRRDPAGMLEEVLSLVRARVRVAPAVGRGPLSPRTLVSVLRAGWGTAWEQALLLTRYLRQLGLDAVPVPVRPRQAGAGDPESPVGYTAAAVRVGEGDPARWVVPACVLCAVGEVPAELHEAAALGDAITRMPAASRGRVDVRQGNDGTATVVLEGAAARWLRGVLLTKPPAQRLASLPAAVGAEGSTLLSHDGLAVPGETVTLVFAGSVAGPPLPRVALEGSRDVVLPWAGTWTWTPVPADADTTPFDNGLVAWSVAHGSATARLASPVAPRREAALGLAMLDRRLGR